ncbi:MAG: ABC transporter substrate-binding protein, partial [Bifidobacterium crudilactis]|nr:ABC transporter substrate-binding protein [Bifidobacterium crudilactis]
MQRKEQRSWKSGIIFLVTLVVLGSIAWIVWSTFNHRLPLVSNPLTSQESISVGVLDAPQSLDIRSEQDPAITQALLGNVYQTLVGKNDRNAPEAAIAKSWDVSGNGLTYTFHLSDNATFSNGDELNAQDVVWSLQQTITKKFQGSDALSALSAVNELDDHSVRITLKSPSPDLLQTLSGRAGIIYDQDAKLNYSSQVIGSGPYVVSQWDKGSSLTLSRNTRYWASAPKIGDITLRYYGNASELSKALESGDVDVATPLDAAGLQTAQNNTSLAVAKGLSQDSVVLAFNTDTSSVLSDQRLRQAIRYLVDNDDIISKQQGLGAAIGGPLSPLDAGYEDLTGLFP